MAVLILVLSVTTKYFWDKLVLRVEKKERSYYIDRGRVSSRLGAPSLVTIEVLVTEQLLLDGRLLCAKTDVLSISNRIQRQAQS